MRQVRLATLQPDAVWELCNEHGQRQETLMVLRRVLGRNSYDKQHELPTIKALQCESKVLRAVWRYSGALIEHLYLDLHDDLAYAERAARLCRVLIAYFQQPDTPNAQAALPALWRSYRDALGIMVVARGVVLQLINHITDQGERNRKFEALLSRQEHTWLIGWREELDDLYREAQREVAIRLRFRTLELTVHAAAGAGAVYPLELRVEGSTSLLRANFEPDLTELHTLIDPHEYGRQLGKQLFADADFRRGYEQIWGERWGRGEYLRVLLRVEPPELRALAWERMYHPWLSGWQPLGTTHTTPFARLVDFENPELAPPKGEISAEAQRILVIIASPSNLHQYNLDPITPDERTQYYDLFASLPDHQTQFLESGTEQRPTLDNLSSALLDGYDLIHIVCHGVLGRTENGIPNTDDYALLLEDGDGRCARVTATQILAALGTVKRPPRLCFLAACQSGKQSDYTAFVPLGEALVQKRLAERAVAMNGNVGIDTARHFAEAFYPQLAAHRSIDLAMNEARGIVREASDFGAPILFRG